ncbi:unnamed protein product [Prorocentrum cordatum]|uniref:Uncharacterized protein n=1 Tax=Prorocentrum cordatum TaxID=2364126 RepID=A0ABN9VX92_9DINO|nr:unnamed protein product [Polarella glacialis]
MAAPPPSGAPPRLRSLLPRCPPWPAVAQAILESAPNALVQLYALIVWAHPLRGPGRSELAALLRVRRGGVRGPGAGHVGAEGAVPGLRRLHLRCGSDAQPGDRLAYADVGHLRQPDASVRPVVDVAGRLWRHGGPHSRAPVRAVHVRPVRGPAAGAGEPRAAGVALGGPRGAEGLVLPGAHPGVRADVGADRLQPGHLPGAGGQAGEGAHRLQGCRSSARWGCTWSCPSSGASPAATSSRGTLSIGATTRRRATPISGTPTPRPMKRGACWIGWTTRTSRRSEGFPGRPAPRLSNASFHDAFSLPCYNNIQQDAPPRGTSLSPRVLIRRRCPLLH